MSATHELSFAHFSFGTQVRKSPYSDAAQVKLTREEWFTIYTAALGHEVP